MIARLKGILRSKKGMTLIEVIVASAVSSMILIGTLGFMLPSTDNIRKINNMNNAKILSQQILTEFDAKVKYAQSVVIGNETIGTTPSEAGATDGVVIYAEADTTNPDLILLKYKPEGSTTTESLVNQSFYDKIRCDTTFTVSTKGTLVVKIVAHLEGHTTPILVTEKVVKTYNCGAAMANPLLTEGNYIAVTMPA